MKSLILSALAAAGCFWLFCDYSRYQHACTINGGTVRGVVGSTCVFQREYDDATRNELTRSCPTGRGWYVTYPNYWRHTCAAK